VVGSPAEMNPPAASPAGARPKAGTIPPHSASICRSRIHRFQHPELCRWFISGAGRSHPRRPAGVLFSHAGILNGALLAWALGLLTGLFPAVQAMRLRIADALRRA